MARRPVRTSLRLARFLWFHITSVRDFRRTVASEEGGGTNYRLRALWTQRHARRLCKILNWSVETDGSPPVAAIYGANHLGYTDIVMLAAAAPVVFVSKSEVRRWPVIMAVIFAGAPLVDGVPQLSDAEGVTALIAANLFVVSFGMSWGPVVWVLLGEKFPNKIRAAALSLAAAAQWVANWLITVSFPKLRDTLGLAYGFYAICALLSLIFVWKWVSETKGKELEEMDDALN